MTVGSVPLNLPTRFPKKQSSAEITPLSGGETDLDRNILLIRRAIRCSRLIIGFCLVVVCCCSGTAFGQNANAPLSLTDCIQKAMSVASPLTLARKDREIADRDRTIARSGFLPQGSVNSTYIYNSPSLFDRTAVSFLALNAIREFAALATLFQEIDTSGRVRAEYTRAKANQQIAGANLVIAERDLKRSVTNAYYNLLLARRLVIVLQDGVTESETFERRTNQMAQLGEAARADVVKAAAQTASLRQAASAAQLAAELANQELAAFWTSDVAQPLNIVELLDQSVPEPEPPAVDPTLYLRRPEFQLYDAQRRGFEADAKRERAALLPQLRFSFQWGADAAVPPLSWKDRGYAAFANVNIPVFDWFRSISAVKQAQARAAQTIDTRQIADRRLSQEYQSALSRVRRLYEQISLSRIQMTASEEDLRLSRVRYEGGEGPALDVVVAQNELAQARSNYYSSIASYLNARVDLEVTSGR
jgi:outer membrane protein